MNIGRSLRLALMSYRFLVAHFAAFVRLALPWSIASGVLVAIGEHASHISEWLLLPIARTCICVAWCRTILLDQPIGSAAVFSAREWRFFRVSVIPSAILFGLGAIIFGPAAMFENAYEPIDLYAVLATIEIGSFWILLMAPLLLARAAIAIDDPEFGICRSMRASGRIILPIFLGAMAAYVPVFLMLIIPDGSRRSSDWIGIGTIFLEYCGYALLGLASDAVLIGFAAYLYRLIASNRRSRVADQF